MKKYFLGFLMGILFFGTATYAQTKGSTTQEIAIWQSKLTSIVEEKSDIEKTQIELIEDKVNLQADLQAINIMTSKYAQLYDGCKNK